MPALLGHSHRILHNSRGKKSCDSTRLSKQSSAGLRNPQPQTSPLQPALPILERLKWQHKRGAQVSAVTPQLAGFHSQHLGRGVPCWSSLRVAFSLHCSCGGLPAQNRFTHLHDCHCPFSLILGSHNVLTVLLIFPGPGCGGVPECITRPGSVWLFCSQQFVSKPSFSPLPVFLSSAALCSASQTTSLEWHRLLPDSRLVRICSHSSCRQELFSWHSRGTDTTILWTSCVISAQKSSSSSICKVEDNCSSLGSQELCLTHPGCCFGSSLQPTMDFQLL